MAGITDDTIREIHRKIDQEAEKYVILNERVRARFTPEEIEHIRAVKKQYSQKQIDKHLNPKGLLIFLADGDPDDRDQYYYEYYMKLLELPLKKKRK